jgi:hypothetical protein
MVTHEQFLCEGFSNLTKTMFGFVKLRRAYSFRSDTAPRRGRDSSAGIREEAELSCHLYINFLFQDDVPISICVNREAFVVIV